jgi:signal transduction histidine kinase
MIEAPAKINKGASKVSANIKNPGGRHSDYNNQYGNHDDLDEMYYYAEIGKASSGILHDVLNPISGLMLYLDFLKNSQQGSGSEIVSEAKNASDLEIDNHIQAVIESSEKLREFIRIIQKNFKQTDESNGKNGEKIHKPKIKLDEVINDVFKILSHKIRMNNVTINFIHEKIPAVSVDSMKIYQIIINLISNAIDSFDDFDNEDSKNTINIVLSKKINDQNNIEIKISDNGCGIGVDNIEDIFNQNYTTKKHGLGIGLSTTRRIIEQDFNGNIKIERIKSGGTLCKVKIPIK